MPLCERKYTKKRKPVPTIFGRATNKPVLDWECEECASADDRLPTKYPVAIVVEDTVNWRGDYWERSLHPLCGERARVHRLVPANCVNRSSSSQP